jgi:branched-chain amino acid transport system ATP-binding protein
MEPVVLCENLYAGYDGQPVVRDFDLRLQQGEIVALLGPNGAGKTTVLMTIAGLLPTIDGHVRLHGQPVNSRRPHLASKQGLVLVPDDRALFPGLTVLQHLRLARPKHGLTTEEVLTYFPALTDILGRLAGLLSGGEQQMLAMARAMIQRPTALLIDEMSMGLAPLIVANLMSTLRQITEDTGTSMLLVEQHVALALEVADHGKVLVHGDTTLDRNAAELRSDRGLIERAYLGDDSFNSLQNE